MNVLYIHRIPKLGRMVEIFRTLINNVCLRARFVPCFKTGVSYLCVLGPPIKLLTLLRNAGGVLWVFYNTTKLYLNIYRMKKKSLPLLLFSD